MIQLKSPNISICRNPSCKVEFRYRSNKLYCSGTCRLADNHQKQRQIAKAVGIKIDSPTTRRLEEEIFDSSKFYTDRFYQQTTSQQKLDLCFEILALAAEGNNKLRKVLTAPKLITPDVRNRSLFYRGNSHNTKTIAEIVNALCIHVFGKGSIEVLRDKDFTPSETCDLESIPVHQLSVRTHSVKAQKPSYVIPDEVIDLIRPTSPVWVNDLVKRVKPDNHKLKEFPFANVINEIDECENVDKYFAKHPLTPVWIKSFFKEQILGYLNGIDPDKQIVKVDRYIPNTPRQVRWSNMYRMYATYSVDDRDIAYFEHMTLSKPNGSLQCNE